MLELYKIKYITSKKLVDLIDGSLVLDCARLQATMIRGVMSTKKETYTFTHKYHFSPHPKKKGIRRRRIEQRRKNLYSYMYTYIHKQRERETERCTMN